LPYYQSNIRNSQNIFGLFDDGNFRKPEEYHTFIASSLPFMPVG
jgi:hypothetical protein